MATVPHIPNQVLTARFPGIKAAALAAGELFALGFSTKELRMVQGEDTTLILSSPLRQDEARAVFDQHGAELS